jgi:hypothetical protein
LGNPATPVKSCVGFRSIEVDTAEAGIANETVVDWARKKIKVLRAYILKAFAHGLCSDRVGRKFS